MFFYFLSISSASLVAAGLFLKQTLKNLNDDKPYMKTGVACAVCITLALLGAAGAVQSHTNGDDAPSRPLRNAPVQTQPQ